jgi:hypothetical protein
MLVIKRIIILDKRGDRTWGYIFWADVPAGREKYYAKSLEWRSAYMDVTPTELAGGWNTQEKLQLQVRLQQFRCFSKWIGRSSRPRYSIRITGRDSVITGMEPTGLRGHKWLT